MAWWPHTQQVSVKKGSAHHNQWKTGFYSTGVLYFHKAIRYYWNQARSKIIFISACVPKCNPSSNPCYIKQKFYVHFKTTSKQLPLCCNLWPKAEVKIQWKENNFSGVQIYILGLLHVPGFC